MSSVLSNIGNFAKGNWKSLIPLGLGGVSSIMGHNRESDLYNFYLKQAKERAALTPQAISSGISALEAPLSLALKQNVGNSVQGMLAERGLGQAPGIFATVLAQALAPYAQQNRQMAADSFWRKYADTTNPASVLGTSRSPNMTSLWQQLLANSGNRGGGTTAGGSVPAWNPAWGLTGSDGVDWNNILPWGQ